MFSRKYKDEEEEDDEDVQMNDNGAVEDGSDCDDSDDDDSGSDSSSDDDQEDETPNLDVEHLEIKLRQDPYTFDRHLDYVNALCKTNFKQRLREARHAFLLLFPLPDSVWLPWLADDSAASDLDRQAKIALFEKATQDFICRFVAADDVEEARKLYERAIIKCSDHLVDARRLWAAYRTFEQMELSKVDAASKEGVQAIQRIRTLYQRQLSTPQMELEATWTDYAQWEESLGAQAAPVETNEALKARFNSAIALTKERAPHEEAVAKGGVDAWTEYIAFERRHGKPTRVIMLYERAIKAHSSDVTLWMSYFAFIEHDFKPLDRQASVVELCERAARAIYWSGTFWTHYITMMEQYGKPFEEISALFERALVAGLAGPADFKPVFNIHIDCMWRAYKTQAMTEDTVALFRAAFERMYSYLSQYVNVSADMYQVVSDVLFFWAKMEARQFKSEAEMRRVFELILSFNQQYHIWAEYISLELNGGHADECRVLYQRAIKAIELNQLWQDYIDFERIYGTAIQQQDVTNQYDKWVAKQYKAIERTMEKEKKEQDRDNNKDNKRKKNDRSDKKPERDTKKAKIDNRPTRKTLFISNINFSTTLEEVKQFFSKAGAIDDTSRLVTNKLGRSKGIAFLDFADDSGVKKALEMNGQQLQGKPLTIEYAKLVKKNEPTVTASDVAAAQSSNAVPFQPLGIEGRTVFLNNLAGSVTKEKIEEYFTKHGVTFVDCRLISKPGGKPFCYIDLPDQEQVNKSLQLNQKYFMGKILNVAMSKPPGQKKEVPHQQEPKPDPYDIKVAPLRKPSFFIPRGLVKMPPKKKEE
eukprot:gene3895-4505_t